MPRIADAVLQDEDGRSVLRMERSYDHPVERVWRALTDADEQAGWHPTPARVEPFVGGGVSYTGQPGTEDSGLPDGEVTDYDPPRLLGYTWGEDHLLFELQPQDHGCRLVLTHTFGDRYKAARDAAGWHLCLEWLLSVLDGSRQTPQPDADGFPAGWRELNEAYERRFEIPPEKATPPPRR